MKRKLEYKLMDKKVVREINYIPVRYIFAVLITVIEIIAIISIVVALCYYVPYFYLLAYATQIACVIKIMTSDDNPDYKVPWLLFVMILPIAGFMLYFMFYSRKLDKKFIKRLKQMHDMGYKKDNAEELSELAKIDPRAASEARMLAEISYSQLFTDTKQTYFALGEDMWASMLKDLERAEKFIFLEYFIIEEGEFWNSVLDILKRKARQGVEVRVLYDDIGCMSTLPGNYKKVLASYGIKATPFSILKGQANNEFNNRSHRKIMVIDGRIGYTGGVNIADEYINKRERFGHWKDTGIRLEGPAVYELSNLFIVDYGINVRDVDEHIREDISVIYPECESGVADGYLIPFGDGPSPIYKHNVGKTVIQNMLYSAEEYVYMTTPYLIIDNDLCTDIENTAMRGVDVRIIVPHVPDKKLVFTITQSFYQRLTAAGVKIYEYEPGFIHAKSYVCDGKYAMIGTINLDYRSLVHHFENGVWMYGCECIKDIKTDIDRTIEKSILITEDKLKTGIFIRLVRSLGRIFSPLL